MDYKTTLTQIQCNVLCAENISKEDRVWLALASYNYLWIYEHGYNNK